MTRLGWPDVVYRGPASRRFSHQDLSRSVYHSTCYIYSLPQFHPEADIPPAPPIPPFYSYPHLQLPTNTLSSRLYLAYLAMPISTSALVAVGLAILAMALWKAFPVLLHPFTSPLRHLPGPPNASLFWGQFLEIFKVDTGVLQEKWMGEYGNVIAFQGMLGVSFASHSCRKCFAHVYDPYQRWRLYTHDERALNHILTHSVDYQKPEVTRFNLINVVGPGNEAPFISPWSCLAQFLNIRCPHHRR